MTNSEDELDLLKMNITMPTQEYLEEKEIIEKHITLKKDDKIVADIILRSGKVVKEYNEKDLFIEKQKQLLLIIEKEEERKRKEWENIILRNIEITKEEQKI